MMFRRIFSHLADSWLNHFSLQVLTFSVLVFGFSAIVAVLLINSNAQKLLSNWGEKLQMTIYFSEQATAIDKEELQNKLLATQKIKQIHYINHEIAVQLLKNQISGFAPELLNDPEISQALPESLELEMSENILPEKLHQEMQSIATQFSNYPGVSEINFGQEWTKNYSAVVDFFSYGGRIFIFLIILSAGFIISNVMGTTLQQRRHEIEVMELIGATPTFIRTPFVIEGAFMGFFTSLFGIFFGYGLYLAVKELLSLQLELLRVSELIQFLSGPLIFEVIIIGTIAGALSAFLSIQKLNDHWSLARGRKS